MSTRRSRTELSSLLSRSDSRILTSLVDDILLNNPQLGIEVVRVPEIGTVQLQVREPICEERFILADSLVTVAEVAVNGHVGWAMRMGPDPEATTAAAIADALVAAAGDVVGFDDLLILADDTERTLLESRSAVARRSLDTTINFEELD